MAANRKQGTPEDSYARGVADGKRAAVEQVARALDAILSEADGDVASTPSEVAPARRPPPRLGVGVDRARLDRFLRAMSDGPTEPVRPTPASIEPATTTDASAPIAPTPAAEPPPAPPRSRGHAQVVEYVRQRAKAWWDRASDAEYPLAARAEARAIAGELFDLAEALARGDDAG